MIDAFFDYSYGELEYRSVRFENETVDSNNAQGNAVLITQMRKLLYTDNGMATFDQRPMKTKRF